MPEAEPKPEVFIFVNLNLFVIPCSVLFEFMDILTTQYSPFVFLIETRLLSSRANKPYKILSVLISAGVGLIVQGFKVTS